MEKIEKSPEVEKYLKKNKWRIPIYVDIILVSSIGVLVTLGFKLAFTILHFFSDNYQGYELLGDIILLLFFLVGGCLFLGIIYVTSRGVPEEFAAPRNILIFGQAFTFPFILESLFDYNLGAIAIFCAVLVFIYLILYWSSLNFPRFVNNACAWSIIVVMILVMILQVIAFFGPSKEEIEVRKEAEREKKMKEFSLRLEKITDKHYEKMMRGESNVKELEKEIDELMIRTTNGGYQPKKRDK